MRTIGATGKNFESSILLTAASNQISLKNQRIQDATRPDHNNYNFLKGITALCGTAVSLIRSDFITISRKKVSLSQKISHLIRHELKAHTTPFKAAQSLGIGVFLAITPFHGLQVIMLLVLSFIFKLNRPLAFLGVSISSAPLLPFWIAASIMTGKLFLRESITSSITVALQKKLPPGLFEWIESRTGIEMLHGFGDYCIGSLILAALSGIFIFTAAFYFFSTMKKRKRKQFP